MKYKNFNRDILKCHFEEGWSKWPSDSNKGIAMPAIQKSCNPRGKLFDLVAPDAFKFDMKLQDVIKNRRSRRKFTQDFLTLKELSFLLWATQGITDRNITYHRTVPSASARHPFETYLVIRRVKDLKPGIYRYLPLDHRLYLISDDKVKIEKFSTSGFEVNNQQMKNAALVFVWAAVPYRSEWRSGPYAYKFVAIDAGHVCQNLYLAVETIHAGACAIAAYDQSVVDEVINVNGQDEFAVYLATVGKVA
ncbi:MAG: SagB/ThcOx family dehydrogenase [Coxiellaceae bacterium]|jgi:SagB-type dehydrogenase family enzyme|nr:SagB/ThcOx family dehydrogenase [Coxiellaceae bacterium]